MAYKVKNSFYDTKKWLRKRANVLRRDEYRCKECLMYGTTREAKAEDLGRCGTGNMYE